MTALNVVVLWAFLCLAVCFPLLFLSHVLDVEAATSPAWQVGFFNFLLVVLGTLLYFMAVYLFMPEVAGWMWVSLGLWALLFAGFLALAWWRVGVHPGLRGGEVEGLLALFAVVSPLAVIVIRPVLSRFLRVVS